MNGRFQVALNSASFGLVNFVSKSLGNLDDKSLVELEKESSTAARIFLLICSFRIYQTGPSLGQGIEIAHSLAPHNCFLLFAVAFGSFGWLIVFFLLHWPYIITESNRGVIFALAIALISFFSHDIFLMPGLIVVIAIGYAGLTVQDNELLDRNIEIDRTLGKTVIVGGTVFILGLLVLSSTRTAYEVNLEKRNIQAMEGNNYYYFLERPSFSGIFRVKNNGFAARKNSTEEKFLFFEDQSAIKKGANWSVRNTPVERGQFWQYHRRALIFTTIDGTDPRTNMRNYRVIAPIEIHPLYYFLLLLTLAWTIVSARWLGMPPQLDKG